jgi:hypothetical protein
MNKIMTFLGIILMPLSVWTMTPIMDSDLSDVNSPTSLTINPDQIVDIKNFTRAWGDYDVISKFLLNSIIIRKYFDIQLDEYSGSAIETDTIAKHIPFSFDSRSNNMDAQIFMIDPITGKNYTTIDANADAYNRNYMNSDYLDKMEHYLTYHRGYTSSPNSPIYIKLESGMRDYYTGPTEFSVPKNSWMDIKVH